MRTTTRIMNAQAIISLYGEFPAFNGAEITDVHIKRDEPRILVKLITKEKPKTCPKRWPSDYDEVFIGLSFIGMSGLLFSQWESENVIEEIGLKDVGERVSVRFLCKNQATLTFSCDWIRFESITYGYVGTP